ncbi:nitroreductase family protein [Actinoplanes sp. NEAU-A12]|uniref:Nitroreductase family protein n=1 Tax=Actinoplanes sandaracinus TaxID=3045177 RepID=A0ABT6X1J8_9ACTN|nr:nitroreductase family protein [Actinoplanes sandaracinus]MDI6105880.1 nitroreductase family protein [Actinoplanes sandaracinus]
MKHQSDTALQQLLTRCVRAAGSAPSLHNSQPWWFRIDGDTVEVHADPARRLEVLDPSGRELMISVGAAVFTLRAAIRGAGRIPDFDVFPDPELPNLVARVRLGMPSPPSAMARALADAIPLRHTNRRPFHAAVVPADDLARLREAAAFEGAILTVAGAAGRTIIVGLGQAAEQRLRSHTGYRAELSHWTRPVTGRRDGIPATAIGPWDALERMPVRDFGLVNAPPVRRSEPFEAYPTIMILATGGDRPHDWVCAGQALQRVLLTATRAHLATTPISQPVEVPAIRELLSGPGSAHHAQMIIRLGYGEPAPVTPRRPLAEVLHEDQPR